MLKNHHEQNSKITSSRYPNILQISLCKKQAYICIKKLYNKIIMEEFNSFHQKRLVFKHLQLYFNTALINKHWCFQLKDLKTGAVRDKTSVFAVYGNFKGWIKWSQSLDSSCICEILMNYKNVSWAQDCRTNPPKKKITKSCQYMKESGGSKVAMHQLIL